MPERVEHGTHSTANAAMRSARAILAHIDALTIERDAAVAALAQRDAEIVAWLRSQSLLYGAHKDANAVTGEVADWADIWADAIERGEYRRTGDVAED